MTIQDKAEEYIQSLFREETNELIQSMEEYAKDNHVPIMEQMGIQLLLQFITIHQPNKILEIGTAIGYSAIRMAKAVPTAEVVTLERDEERISVARRNLKQFNGGNRIQIVAGDALDKVNEVAEMGPFDILFIDAAKGQYEKFFRLYEPFISVGGLIISDNVLFKGMVTGEKGITSKRMEKMVDRLKVFNEERMNDPRFSTMIYPVGDGVMVSYKKANKKSNE